MGTLSQAELKVFSDQYQRLAANLAGTPGQLEIAKARAGEYRRLFEEVGADRFTLGATAAIDRHATGFFPTLGEFKDFVPSSVRRELQQCPRCEASGCGRYIEKRMVNGKFYDFAVKCDHKPVEAK